MDHSREIYELKRNQLPFYYSYPMQRYYYEEAQYEKDLDRLKSVFPKSLRKIQGDIERECDQLDYEGSPLFDECPDWVTLHLMCKRIQGMHQEEIPMELIEMTMMHEVHRRRCRYQRSRHCW